MRVQGNQAVNGVSSCDPMKIKDGRRSRAPFYNKTNFTRSKQVQGSLPVCPLLWALGDHAIKTLMVSTEARSQMRFDRCSWARFVKEIEQRGKIQLRRSDPCGSHGSPARHRDQHHAAVKVMSEERRPREDSPDGEPHEYRPTEFVNWCVKLDPCDK